MKDWEKVLVSPETTIRETIKIIDESSLQIVLVVDKNNRLLGTITDGDIRRGLLRGKSLESSVKNIYYVSPITGSVKDDADTLHKLMVRKFIKHLPVLDNEGKVVRLEILKEILQKNKHSNPVVLMAGGLGSRLRPLTDDFPKPLLKVGGKPVLETILENFISAGFGTFYISVNYKAEMIEKYFGDGSKWGVEILYLREEKQLGTAGSLHLITERPTLPFIVMNGDLLTKVKFEKLVDFHNSNNELKKSMATMCVREFNMQIPYGVVKKDGNKLLGIDEKPVQRFFVNAGIYVMEPDVLDIIPRDTKFDMTDLFGKLLEDHKETVIFQIREYWMDIGHMKDFEEANGEYDNIFSM